MIRGLRALAAKLRDPVIILPYLGHGTPSALHLTGRVLRDKGLPPARDAESRWRNLVAFLRRMETDEVRGARLRASFQGRSREAVSDGEGYFRIELPARSLRPGWHGVELALAGNARVRATARVLVPSPRAQFAVVSDIDDTIVYSNVARKLAMVVSLALSNARTRKPFKGVAAFYRALHRSVNPIFYVSKSPWNLYAPLVEFLEHQGLPLGPLFLRDFGLRMKRNHKAQAIDALLAAYPRLPFVLIGDSGEEDPEIYAQTVRRHPRRIRAIYIRMVRADAARLTAMEKLVREVASTGCQLVLAPDSEFAAAHAAAEGLIRPAALAGIRAERRADLARPKLA